MCDELQTYYKCLLCPLTVSRYNPFLALCLTVMLHTWMSWHADTPRHAAQALCINDAVLKLGSATRINERCLELQTAKASKKAAAAGAAQDKPSATKAASLGCPFRKANKSSMRHLKVSAVHLEPRIMCASKGAAKMHSSSQTQLCMVS